MELNYNAVRTSVEDVGISHEAKVLLKLSCNIVGLLLWKCSKIHKTSGMVFDGHDPTLHLTVDIFLPHGSHINEINLKTITELRGNDWLLGAFPRLDDRCLLMANVAILTVNLA